MGNFGRPQIRSQLQPGLRKHKVSMSKNRIWINFMRNRCVASRVCIISCQIGHSTKIKQKNICYVIFFFNTLVLQSHHLMQKKNLKNVTYLPFPPRKPWQPCGCTLTQFNAEISLIRKFSAFRPPKMFSLLAASRNTDTAVTFT